MSSEEITRSQATRDDAKRRFAAPRAFARRIDCTSDESAPGLRARPVVPGTIARECDGDPEDRDAARR